MSDLTEMTSIEGSSSATPETVGVRRRGRPWLRFHLRQLLGAVACLAVMLGVLNVGIETLGDTTATVEITHYHPTWKPNGSVEFLVQLPNGFSQSAVSVPESASTKDYSQLIGERLTLRYRAQRILWFPAENPNLLAYHRIQARVGQFAGEKADE